MPVTAPDKYHVPQWLGERAERRFHAMAKPAGATCNLDCTYCFCLSKHDLPGGPGRGVMSDELLERYIRDYIASVTADEPGLNYLCPAFRKFFAHAGPQAQRMAIEPLRARIANAESMQASPRQSAAASSTDSRLPTGPVPLED